jgi:peroxiredoxin
MMRIRLLLLAAVLVFTGCANQAELSSDGFVAGDGSFVLLDPADRMPAPDLTGTTLEGDTLTLADTKGDVVLLNVWASWCAPCRAEAPILERVWRDVQDQGVQFIGLDTRDSDAAAQAFVNRFEITYPNVVDRDGRLQLLFGETLPPQAIPSTLLIDRQGRVAARALGKVSESTLRGLLEPLIAEPR